LTPSVAQTFATRLRAVFVEIPSRSPISRAVAPAASFASDVDLARG
jgi:hypothetical protein